jgi:hypothetical protein
MSKLDEIRNRLKNNDGGNTSSSKLDEIRNRLKKDHEILNAPKNQPEDENRNTSSSKLDEIANRLGKDNEILNASKNQPEVEHKNTVISQPKDAGISDVAFNNVEDGAPVVLQAHKRAIFIGNDKYEMPERPLHKCVYDARTMTNFFSKIGYSLVYDYDADSEKMHKHFERFKSDIEEGDELLIYFSGHGIQVNSEIFLTPIDKGSSDLVYLASKHWVNLDKEMDEMLSRGAKIVVAIVDACRQQYRIDYQSLSESSAQEALATEQYSQNDITSTNAVISQMESDSSQGKAVLFASSHNTSSYDSHPALVGLKNGVFTHFFLQEVVKPGRTITEIIERVRGLVSSGTNGEQVPAFQNNLPGDYYFH